MKKLPTLPMFAVAAALIGGIAVLGIKFNDAPKEVEIVSVKTPTLSGVSLEGKTLYDENCASCHGENAAGSDKGPTFIHAVYKSDHHGDQAFVLAALRGVRAHHWQFGNMPKQPQVTQTQVLKIVSYIRELQRANGL